MEGEMRVNQRGVALIQVLLISAFISLLAIQFSKTARQQVSTSLKLNDRVEAQLRVYSSQQKAIFGLLAEQMQTNESSLLQLKADLTGYGTHTTALSEVITLRDISGLLPLQYPRHPLWQTFTQNMDPNESGEDYGSLLSFLQDVQDPDLLSNTGGQEPSITSSGLEYLNMPFSNSKIAKKYLLDWPYIQANVGKLFHTHAQFEVNVMAMDEELLRILLPSDLVEFILKSRQEPSIGLVEINNIINQRFGSDAIVTYPSTYKRISVSSAKGEVLWGETIDVRLSGLSIPPYRLIGRNNN